MTVICMIALAFCGNVRRTYPQNLIFLGIFTLCESCLLSSICSAYGVDEILMAIAVNALIALGLVTFAFQNKYDFTMCRGVVLVILLVLLSFGVITLIFY